MLNGDDNGNGFKTNRSNQQKNKLHVQHAFLSFPCRCFARLQRCFVRLKRQNFPVTHYIYEGIVVCAYPIFCFLCSYLVLFFTAAHFHLILAASISDFLTAALNFHVFLPTKFVSFVFNNSLQLFLCYPRQCKHKK